MARSRPTTSCSSPRARSIWQSRPICCPNCRAVCRSGSSSRLTEPEHSLLKQYSALLATENVELIFAPDAVDALADLAADINDRIENIGARRLATVLEKLLEEISFTASDRPFETVTVDASTVRERVAPLAGRSDLSRFIL